MVTPQLLDYVRQQLAAGIPKEEISKALLLMNWPVADINEAFASLDNPPPAPSPAQPAQPVQSAAAAAAEHKLIPIGRLLGDSLSLYKERFGVVVALLAIPYVLYLASRFWSGSMLGIVLALIGFVTIIITITAVVSAIAKNTGFFDSFKQGLRLFFPVLWVGILLELSVLGGFILFIIPGIILSVWFSLSIFTLVIENKRGTRALFQSSAYVRGYWWAVLGRLLLVNLIVYIPLLALEVLISLAFGGTAGIIANYLLSALVIPFVPAYVYTIYRSLAALKPELAVTTPTSGRGLLITSIIIGLIVWVVLLTGIFVLPRLMQKAYTIPTAVESSTTTPVLTLAPSLYTNAAYRYRITPPAGWHAQGTASGDDEIFMPPEPNPSRASVGVMASKTPYETSVAMQKTLAAYQQAMPGFTVLDKTNTNVGSSPALRVLFTTSGNGGQGEGYLLLVVKDGNLYEVSAQVIAGDWSTYESLFQNVIASFSFIS